MIKDLGTLEGPILAFGGPYSNLQATQAILEQAKKLGISPENVICTGDITAYCGNPQETSETLYKSGIHIIQGNCEESLTKDNDDCACGYEENTACEALSYQWYNFSKNETAETLKKWMGTLPHRIEFIFNSRKFHVLHGSNHSINEFIFSSTEKNHIKKEIEGTGCDIVIAGHCGLHFTLNIDNKIWHNAGVIGMPANDGTPRTWYSVISKKNNHVAFEYKSLNYDHKTAAKTMTDNGLTEYAKTVENGLWPSLDILPQQEKEITGIAREEETIFF